MASTPIFRTVSGPLDEIADLITSASSDGWAVSGGLCVGTDGSGGSLYTQLMSKVEEAPRRPITPVPSTSHYT